MDVLDVDILYEPCMFLDEGQAQFRFAAHQAFDEAGRFAGVAGLLLEGADTSNILPAFVKPFFSGCQHARMHLIGISLIKE